MTSPIPPGKPIFLTGATGWLGRSFLHQLQLIFPSSRFNDYVTAFASASTQIQSSAYPPGQSISIPVHSLSEMPRLIKGLDVLLIHCAFLTKDLLARYGASSFVSINQRITDIVRSSCEVSSSVRAVVMSSGAATIAEHSGQDILLSTSDPYSVLKLRDEQQLTQVSDCQVFRIYGLTGSFIRRPSSYALGDFLLSAHHHRPILVSSPFPVIRGYVSDRDVSACALAWLSSDAPVSNPVPAVSHITTLANLAFLISNLFHLPAPVVRDMRDSPNSYSASPTQFLSFLDKFSLRPASMLDNVLETYAGISELLSP